MTAIVDLLSTNTGLLQTEEAAARTNVMAALQNTSEALPLNEVNVTTLGAILAVSAEASNATFALSEEVFMLANDVVKRSLAVLTQQDWVESAVNTSSGAEDVRSVEWVM